jgi:hypothetical protein
MSRERRGNETRRAIRSRPPPTCAGQLDHPRYSFSDPRCHGPARSRQRVPRAGSPSVWIRACASPATSRPRAAGSPSAARRRRAGCWSKRPSRSPAFATTPAAAGADRAWPKTGPNRGDRPPLGRNRGHRSRSKASETAPRPIRPPKSGPKSRPGPLTFSVTECAGRAVASGFDWRRTRGRSRGEACHCDGRVLLAVSPPTEPSRPVRRSACRGSSASTFRTASAC